MTQKKIKFSVIITFDITVGQRTDIYAEVSKLLEDSGFSKESFEGVPFPENIYLGVVQKPVEIGENNLVMVSELHEASKSISGEVMALLEKIFDIKNVDNKIFIHVSRHGTSATIVD